MTKFIWTFFLFVVFLIPHSQGQVFAIEGLTPYVETGRRVISLPSTLSSGTNGYSVITKKVRIAPQRHRKPFVTFSSTTNFASSSSRRYFLFAEVVVRSSTRFKIRLTVKGMIDGIKSWRPLSTIKFDYIVISRTFPNVYISNTLNVIRGDTSSYPKGIGLVKTHRLSDWIGATPFSLVGTGIKFVWGVLYTDAQSMSSDNRFGMYLAFKIVNSVEFQTILNSVYSIRIKQYKISLLIYDPNAFDLSKINLRSSNHTVPAFGVNTPPQTRVLDGWPNFPGMQMLTGLAGFQFTTANYFAFESYINPIAYSVQITLHIQNLAPTIAIPKLQITYLTASQLTCPNNQRLLDSTLTQCLTTCPAGSTPATTSYGMTGLYACGPCIGACCATGTFWDGASCVSCIANCAMCSTSTNCIVCSTGYLMDENGVCVFPTCPTPCTQCDGLLCIQCLSPYEVGGGGCVCPETMIEVSGVCTSCVTYISNCISCDSTSICAQCSIGYYLTPTFTCAPCVQACELCENSVACIECSMYAYLDGLELCQCDQGAYMSSALGDCAPCSPGCLSCTATICTSCLDTVRHIVSGNQCLCPSGYFTDSQAMCALCSALYPQCTQCNSLECTQCVAKYYLAADKLSCLICPQQCATCTSPTVCTTCEATFQLYGGTASSCVCPIGSFFDGVGSCLLCTIADCLECSSLTLCTACAVGFAPTLAGPCQSCTLMHGPSCATCTASACSTCTAPTTMDSSGTCVCPLGQVYSGSTCVACSDNIAQCAECTSISVCIKCVMGFYLASATSCVQCSTGCASCTSPLSCTQCLSSFIQNVSGNCVCPPGHYYDGTAACLACTILPGCAQCSSPTVCTLCGPVHYQQSGTTSCTACVPNCSRCDSTGCLACQAGFAQVLDATVSQNICQDCKLLYGTACLSCGVSMCTACATDTFWFEFSNQCESISIIKCSDGLWIDQFEACDDGNSLNGDGCSSLCQIETDYECRVQDRLSTGQSLCVFTKQISIAFERLQKEVSSNVVSLFLKAEPSTFMQWTEETIKNLLNPIEIVNPTTGQTSSIPLNSITILFNRNQQTKQIEVVIDYGQNNLEGSYLKFDLNHSATNIPSLKYAKPQTNILLAVDNQKTGVHLFGYTDDMYATQATIGNICTGIGLFTLILAFIGMFAPVGKILIIEAVAVVQISFFSVLQYQKIPPTFVGFKNLVLSNGYNNQIIFAEKSQKQQNIYDMMGLKVDALSNSNISLVFFVLMPTLIAGIGLLVDKYISKASFVSQSISINQTKTHENSEQKRNDDSLNNSKVESIIDKLNSSRFKDLQSPTNRQTVQKPKTENINENILTKNETINLSNQNPQLLSTSFRKVILERVFYQNTFYGIFMVSYLDWVSIFYSFSSFQLTSLPVILIQIGFAAGFAVTFAKITAQRISLKSLLAKDKTSKNSSQNDQKMYISTKFGQFNELGLQKLQNPTDPSVKFYTKLSLIFLAQRLLSSLCIVFLASSMPYAGAILTSIYGALMAAIIIVNKKVNSINEEKKRKIQGQKKKEKQKAFIQIIELNKPKTDSNFSMLSFLNNNYLFRQGFNISTIILIQILFLFANITMTSQDPFETYVNNTIITKLVPLAVTGLLGFNLLLNTFLLIVQIKESFLFAKIKIILGHYFPQSNSPTRPQANQNQSEEKKPKNQQNEKASQKSAKSHSAKEQDEMVKMLNNFMQQSTMHQPKQSPFLGIEEKQFKQEALKGLFKIEQAHKLKMSKAGQDIRSKLITQMWDQI